MDRLLLVGFLVAIIAGGALVATGMLVGQRLLRPVLEAAEARAREATDRLVQAHRDGYAIPEREEASHAEVIEPLPPEVEEWLDQFDEAGRQAYEPKARSLFDTGANGPQIIVQLERLRWSRAEVDL